MTYKDTANILNSGIKRDFFVVFNKKIDFFFVVSEKYATFAPANKRFAPFRGFSLGYGVMVTLQILVLPFLVRVRVPQLLKSLSCCKLLAFFICKISIINIQATSCRNNPALSRNTPALFDNNLALFDNTPRIFLIIPRVFLITPKEKQDFAATLLPPIFPLNRAFDAIWWQGGSKIINFKL